MKRFAAKRRDITEKNFASLLFSRGFGKTLEYYCTFSVFSVLSAD
jgi:hypothetical protein